MKVRELWSRLETLGGQPEDDASPQEVAEAAAVMMDGVLPAVEALGGIRKQLQEAGLTEASVNEFMDGLVHSIVEGM